MRPNRHLPLVVAAFVLFVPALPRTAGDQRQESERSFDRTLTVASGQSLDIEHRHGDIRITTHPRQDLRIQARIRASAPNAEQAAELVERIQIDLEETPSAIKIRTRYPEQAWWRVRRNLSHSVDYTLVMPERMPLLARNSFGNVSLSGLKAAATVVNAHGTLTASDGGARHTLENSFGPIEAARIGADVTITGSNGDVTAATISGALTLTNRFGRVNATAVTGAARVTNSNGQVDVADAASAHVANSFGAVTVRDIRGPLTVSNGNGNVTIANVTGSTRITSSFGTVDLRDVTADSAIENTNGAVKVANVRGGATVRTSFAAVELTAIGGTVTVTNSNGAVSLRDVGGAAEVRTSFGRVEAEGLKAGIRVHNGNSGVRVADARGPVSVTTSFGPVELRNVEGAVEVRNQNGAIDAALTAKPGACHDITLATTFSAIQLQLPDGGYAVTAETSFGKIRSDVPITATGVIGEGRLSGTIGGGGCALRITNANGDIQILKRAAGR